MRSDIWKFALLLCGTCLFVSCANNKYEIQCRNEMRQISISIFSMWQNNIDLDVEDLHSIIIRYNEKNSNGVFNPDYERISKGKILDPRGHAYRIKFDHKTGKVKIWSIGLNGIDESGAGDDITIIEKVAD